MEELKGKYVLHTKTGRLGRVLKVYAEREFIDPNGVPINDVVVQFDTGDAFLAPEPSVFSVLTEKEIQLYSIAKQSIVGAVVEIAEWAKAHDMDLDRTADILVQVLTDQATALRASPSSAS